MSKQILDDDDEDVVGGIYDNGHWLWDDKVNALVFKSDLPEEPPDAPQLATAILGSVEFREDIDLNEQHRFRKRMQRKAEPNDVVTLQDVKDVVLFTAPIKILKPYVINLLHLSATERMLRALIFLCQYHLQTSETMNNRTIELLTKIRTHKSEIVEMRYMENLEDLRLLVAKEYSNMIKGAGEFSKFHHMGPYKKARSMHRRESFLFETFLRISIQIIWITLGRKSFSEIEFEVHRIFKSNLFNSAEHRLTDENKRIERTPHESLVLLGHCLRKKHKVDMLSPLMNEVHCSKRNIDHRMFGLGIVKYPRLSTRLMYMESALSLPENLLQQSNISLGILGLQRSRFDILLREVIREAESSSGNLNKSTSRSTKSATSRKKSTLEQVPMYSNIVLPPRGADDELPSEFPSQSYPRKPCDDRQRKKWLQRYLRIVNKRRTYSSK